jgi:sulfur carrier protein
VSAAPVEVRVNGEPRAVPADTTVAALVQLVGAHPEGVAVAVNGEVVPRAALRTRALVEGDRVEIIRAVGGG